MPLSIPEVYIVFLERYQSIIGRLQVFNMRVALSAIVFLRTLTWRFQSTLDQRTVSKFAFNTLHAVLIQSRECGDTVETRFGRLMGSVNA